MDHAACRSDAAAAITSARIARLLKVKVMSAEAL